MPVTWIDGAERLGAGKIGGTMDSPNRPPRAVWHTTESGAGDGAFDAVARYLRSIGAEPHILYDPTTDRLGQFGPLNESARALKNDGASRTNRTGKVCVQIEVLARAATPFTGYWKPGPNFRRLMDALRGWGIPDAFPMGALASHYGDSSAKRSRDVWLNKAGHYGHSNVPGNDHWDPGAISPSKLFAAAPLPTAEKDDDVRLSDIVKLGKSWLARWSADDGLQDGISVATALGSGYAHSRKASENTDEILAVLRRIEAKL